jgi:hypothetical protein
MSEAFASEDPALMHEWRKDAKYHANQLKVIRPLWPDVLKPTQKVADRLQEDLGDHHDLDVLANFLSRRIERFGGEAAMGPLLALCRTRQERLALSARSAGDRLFAEKPKAFTQRIRAYWSAWRRESRRTEDSAPQKSASLIAEPEAV